ncbi:hypothetical protein MO867_23215, partial [Microbulbifer sp. OS29]
MGPFYFPDIFDRHIISARVPVTGIDLVSAISPKVALTNIVVVGDGDGGRIADEVAKCLPE